MEKRKIGSLEVSLVGLGTNNFGTDFFGSGCDERQSKSIIDAALDSGVNFFDTAEEYSVPSAVGTGQSEQFLGRALGSRRDQAIIASKFQIESNANPEQRGAERIRDAVDGSLQRLGTDYIDLYQQHFPDPDTPPEETMGTLAELVQEGKVREIGCANFTAELLDAARQLSSRQGTPQFRSLQARYSVLDAAPKTETDQGALAGMGFVGVDDEVLAACERNELKVIPFWPLGGGLLTGKYNKPGATPAGSRLEAGTMVSDLIAESYLTEANLTIARELEGYAAEHDHSLLELAFSWLASQPVVASVIAGATSPEQIKSNAASADWSLNAAELAEVEEIVASAMAKSPSGAEG